MDFKPPNRPRARRIILVMFAVIAAFPVAIFLEIWVSSGAIVKRERERVKAGIVALKSQRVERPSLFPPETEGNSWDLLKATLPFWKNSHMDPDRKQFYTDEKGKPRGAEPDLERILETLRPRIEELREALRRRHVDPGHDYEAVGQGIPHVLEAMAVFSVMKGVSAYLRAHDRHREALDAIMVSLGLADHLRVKGQDLTQMISHAGDQGAFEELKQLLEGHHLDSSDLGRMARALDILDSSWPTPLAYYRADDLLSRNSVVVFLDGGPNAESIKKNLPAAIPGWRQLYSDRIFASQLFGLFDQQLAGVEELTSKPVSEWGPAANEANSSMRLVSETLGLPSGNWHWYLKEWGKIRTRYLTARVAVALAWYHAEQGEYPATLEGLTPKFLPHQTLDPLEGQPFGYRAGEDEATVVSPTLDPEFRDKAIGKGHGQKLDGSPAWRVRRK